MSSHALPAGDRRQRERRAAAAAAPAAATAHTHHGSYGRFAAMVATSTALGFVAMYLNVFEPAHVHFSWMRLFMALVMGGVMTAVMLLFMWRMYPGRAAKLGVLTVAAALFGAGVVLARSQATVDDVDYMRAMIPHHSIAILTSSRARIEDPRVRALADRIVETQNREIAEMEALIEELDGR
jgi:peptidoglycan/LPS O-acetylase OafA/YrhL